MQYLQTIIHFGITTRMTLSHTKTFGRRAEALNGMIRFGTTTMTRKPLNLFLISTLGDRSLVFGTRMARFRNVYSDCSLILSLGLPLRQGMRSISHPYLALHRLALKQRHPTMPGHPRQFPRSESKISTGQGEEVSNFSKMKACRSQNSRTRKSRSKSFIGDAA